VGYRESYGSRGLGSFGMGGGFPDGVKWLLIANALVFIIQHWLFPAAYAPLVSWLGLSSSGVLHGKFWQLGTYLFLHGDFGHFFFNMLYLFMFGAVVERAWGRDAFLRYYFYTGIGAAIVWTLFRFGSDIPTVGASGAVYAIMVAFAVLYPNATILLFFVLPVKAKYLVGALIGLSVFYQLRDANDGVAHLVHLAGAAIGFVLLKRGDNKIPRIPTPWGWYRRWRVRRKLSVIDYRELMKLDDERDSGSSGRRGPR
jgi:membrane associated rhomboid family serine protease